MQPEQDDDRATVALLADLARLAGVVCAACPAVICGHEALLSVALGAKDAPRCLRCLAASLERTPDELREQLTEHFRGRICYSRAWQSACDREGQPHSFRPICLDSVAPASSARSAVTETGPTAVADTWDAGDLGCGDLVLALRIRLNGMPPGSVLLVTARDPAAPEDLPAWCRLTGHRLVSANHPVYRIRRKEA